MAVESPAGPARRGVGVVIALGLAGWAAGVVLLASDGGLAGPELPFVSAAGRPWSALLKLFRHHAQGFVYVVALRAWMTVSTGELWLRLFSAACAAVAVLGIAVLAKVRDRARVHCVAIVLGAAIGLFRPATRVEPTALAFALVIGSILGAQRLRQASAHAWRSWLPWLSLSAAMVGTSIVLVPLVILESVWLVYARHSAAKGTGWMHRNHDCPSFVLPMVALFAGAGAVSLVLSRPTDWRPVVSLVAASTQPHDAILFAGGSARLAFEYYRSNGTIRRSLPTPVHPLAPWGGFGIEDVGGAPPPQTFDRARDSFTRLWIVAPSRRYGAAVEVAHHYPAPSLQARFGAAYVFLYDFGAPAGSTSAGMP